MKPDGKPATWWVGNGHPEALDDIYHGFRAQKPLATIAAALRRCLSGRGDLVEVLPFHVEPEGLVIRIDRVTIHGNGLPEHSPILQVRSGWARGRVRVINCRKVEQAPERRGRFQPPEPRNRAQRRRAAARSRQIRERLAG